MMLYAKFTPDGIPGHIITQAREGYEVLPSEMTIAQAAVSMLVDTPDGRNWMPRPPVQIIPPTEQELAAQAEAERESAELVRDQAVREALTKYADPLFFKWQRDEGTRSEWLQRIVEIKAAFPRIES